MRVLAAACNKSMPVAVLFNALSDSNSVLHFASATCGNDVVSGSPTSDETTPEPASLALMGAGLAAPWRDAGRVVWDDACPPAEAPFP